MTPRIHLDHAASTPVRPEVLDAFVEAATATQGGNPNAGHAVGRAARTVLEDARERIGVALDRSAHEVVFTSGGAEADALAVVGLWRAAAERGRRHLVCSAVDHPAVRDAATWLAEHEGADVTWVAPDGARPVEVATIEAAMRDDTGLVAVTAADGEIGVRQHGDAIAALADGRGVACHLDTVQAVATGPVPAGGALAITGHKLGAPAGIGAALLPRHLPTRPLVGGPGQERGLRHGTQPAALAAALATAVELAVAERDTHAAHARDLTTRLAAALADTEGLRTTLDVDAPFRLPTHLHVLVDGVDGEALATALDAVGVAASTGTACATGSAARSAVLDACGIVADATLRLSVGRTTTLDEVTEAATRIDEVIAKLRATGGGFL